MQRVFDTATLVVPDEAVLLNVVDGGFEYPNVAPDGQVGVNTFTVTCAIAEQPFCVPVTV